MNKITKEKGYSQTLSARLQRAVAVAGFLFLAGDGLAQTLQVSSSQPIGEGQLAQADSVVAVTADAYGLSQMALESLPVMSGTFYIVEANGVIPPFPCLPPQYWNCPAWKVVDGIYLVDATGGKIVASQRLSARSMMTRSVQSAQPAVDAEGNAVANLIEQVQQAQLVQATAMTFGSDILSPADGSGGVLGADYSTGVSGYSFDTNQLWLEMTNVSNSSSFYNLRNATNQVYAIMTTTDMTQLFTVESELFPADTNCQPFTLQNNDRQYLFVRAMDWTGVTENGNQTPDWWFWLYFGTTALSDNDLDASDKTLLYDYNNQIIPGVFSFSGTEVTNSYVNSSSASVQLDVTGNPYYLAVLVDNTNYDDAVWNNYSSSNVVVNLGINEGWHDIWIGLRGHADKASAAVWLWNRLKLDFTPPALIVTSPTNSTVTVPLIQLTGFSPEALAGISYDISNAARIATNQQAMIVGQAYNTNTVEFTTNYFQCYDIPLADGTNAVTLHAMDLAGNVTTITNNIIYVASTNPPVIDLIWPQNGMQISGGSLTIQGQVNDPTASVSVAVADTNGNTNLFNGLAGRDGNFWIQGVSLNAGTNNLSISIGNEAGITTTNFTVIQTNVTLTINPIVAGQTQVSGSIGASGYTVWVNGVQTTQTNGTWTAQIAAVCIGGGVVNVTAIPNSDNGGNGSGGGGGTAMTVNPNSSQSLNTQETVASPQGPFISAYHLNDQRNYLPIAYFGPQGYDPGCLVETYNIVNWDDGKGGSGASFRLIYWDTVTWDFGNWAASSWPQVPDGSDTSISGSVYDADLSTLSYATTNSGTSSPIMTQEHCNINITTPDGFGDPYCHVQRNADAEIKLATGGPLGSTRQNLWLITGSGSEDTTGNPIPYNQISIGNFGNLDTNGNLYVVLPDNDPDTITPHITGKNNYSFGANAKEYQVVITANGVTLDADNVVTGADFCVGQYIQFNIVGLPNHNKNDDVAIWTLPGTFVNTNSDSNCDLFYDKNTALLTRHYAKDGTVSTFCWYVLDGQQVTVSVDLYYDFYTAGKIFKQTITGKFNVHRPTTTFSKYDDGTPTVMVTNGWLSLGWNRNQDMSFHHQINSGNFSGKAGYTQLIFGSYTDSGTGNLIDLTANGIKNTELDNGEFYRGKSAIPTNITSTVVFWDGPADGLHQGNAQEDVDFSTYLLFQPDAGPGPNIFVPLRLVTWELHDEAAYGAVVSGNAVSPADNDCTDFPHWTSVFSNLRF